MSAGAEALLQGGRFHEAHAALRETLQRDPDSLPARLGLARACLGMNDRAQAAAWLADACRVAPGQAQPLQLLAQLLLDGKLYGQALQAYARLHGEFGLRDRATLLHYGFCREQLGQLDEAVVLYRAALEADPAFMEAHVDLAGVLWRVGDFDGALAHAQQAVALAPSHPYAQRILGTALLNLNRLPEAEAALRRALALQPGFGLAELDLAFALLAAGRLGEGWHWYERRWAGAAQLHRPAFHDPRHEWRGPAQQPLEGRRIAVYAEQGLGDVLQFVRYLPLLQRQGAAVGCVVAPELVGLIEHSMPGVLCLTPQRPLQVDLHAALLDLPLRLGTALDSIPASVPYLRAPPARAAAWRERLAPWRGRRRIGLAWSGNPAQVNNRNRTLALDDLQPLLALPGICWFSLQKSHAGSAEVQRAGLVDLTAEWADFGDSAAMIEQLDLVITVDTSTAHLAGALGRPVWTLLAPNADWRWLLDREDSPWYPTMRLFRRGFGEARSAQVARVGQALASL